MIWNRASMFVLTAVASSASAFATVELRVVSAMDGAVWEAGADEEVLIVVQGRLVGERSRGLASWSVTMRSNGSASIDLCKCAGLWSIDDEPNFISSCDDTANLLHGAGGARLMRNTVSGLSDGTGVISGEDASSEWIDLAEGWLTTPADFEPGDSIVLELDEASARTSVVSNGATNSATRQSQTKIVGSLTIEGLRQPVVISAWSWGYHGYPVSADMPIQVFPMTSMIEPRQVEADGSRIYLEVVCNVIMNPGRQVVSSNPRIVGIVAGTPLVSNSIYIEFPKDLPVDEQCYWFDVAGSLDSGFVPVAPGNAFCVCFNEGDVDRSETVNAGDRNLVVSPTNFFLPANIAAYLTADVDRSGIVNAGDRNIVVGPANFFRSPLPCP